jgi:hypothetical protein
MEIWIESSKTDQKTTARLIFIRSTVPLQDQNRRGRRLAVLGAVLSGIYYFRLKANHCAPSPLMTVTARDGSEEAITDSSSPIDKKSSLEAHDSEAGTSELPQAIEANGSLAAKDKLTSQKKIKKGGLKQ